MSGVETTQHLPLIAMTLGDVCGIGPEVVVRAAVDEAVRRSVVPVLVGNAAVVRRTLKLLKLDHAVEEISPVQFEEWRQSCETYSSASVPSSKKIACWNIGSNDVADCPMGQVHSAAGRAAYDALNAAIDAALEDHIDGIVTAPLNKLALHQAGINVPGHTEILGERCGVPEVVMMLHLDQGEMISNRHGLSVAHVTLHTSIASVPQLLSVDRIESTILLMEQFLSRIGVSHPRVAVCALNPHGGEAGLFGDEETTLIQAAIDRARRTLTASSKTAATISGPFPTDTLMRRAVVDAEFDGIVAMYHDQGHIPFKLIGFDRAVNITLGLPIVRTSPSHGTAFEIAGQGIANPSGMIAATKIAAQLAGRRQENL